MIPLSILKRHFFWFGEQWEREAEEDRKKENYEEGKMDNDPKVTCCNLICFTEKLQFEKRIKEMKGELSKWDAPHEDSNLQEMKEQSKQASLGAKQAYINALEYTIKHREVKIKEMEKAIKKHKKQNPWKALPRKIDTELYKVIKKEVEDGTDN